MDNPQGEDSASGTYSSQSATTAISQVMAEFRNFNSLTRQKTPRTLSIIIKLILLLYIIMMGISSINLAIII
jgi:hypothetical protein